MSSFKYINSAFWFLKSINIICRSTFSKTVKWKYAKLNRVQIIFDVFIYFYYSLMKHQPRFFSISILSTPLSIQDTLTTRVDSLIGYNCHYRFELYYIPNKTYSIAWYTYEDVSLFRLSTNNVLYVNLNTFRKLAN